MPSSPKTYPDWKAPTSDGQILVWPQVRAICDDAALSRERLSQSDVRVQNVPLSEVRRRQREWLGHDDVTPLIADGHQAELYHPGVWAKSALGDLLAGRVGGAAFHVAIDTDAPKHLTLKWLGGAVPITDDPQASTAEWAGLLDSPSPAHLAEIEKRLVADGFDPATPVMKFLSALRRLALEQPTLPSALTQACHEVDWELGLRHHAILASPMFLSEPFLVLAHHVIARAGEFASAYNAALHAYRSQNKIRSETRPMPDLIRSNGSVESPFWLDELATGNRTRAKVIVNDGGFVLRMRSGEEFQFDPAAQGWDAAARLAQWLRRNQVRLAPRALTLTMFLRLFVADQFIHGIGGARYDQVTDAIIADHFKIEPPPFCVTTATLVLPQALQRTRVCVPCIEQEGHRLRHALLGPRKREFLERIEASPRKSPQRYAAFAQMHRELATAVKTSRAVGEWEQRLREAQRREAEEAVLFDRELFYALQPRNRLEELIERYRQEFSA